jgi:phosphoribosylformylglycinamidine synthase
VTTSALNLFHFEGGNALSAFRSQALLAQLAAINGRIQAVHARHVHWVACDHTPKASEADKLAALLSYGDAYQGPAGDAPHTALVVVAPRLGTVSPWASKATDIAHIAGWQQALERSGLASLRCAAA